PIQRQEQAGGKTAAASRSITPAACLPAEKASYWPLYCLIAIAMVVLGQFMVGRYDWVAKYPSSWMLPIRQWIDAFFEWLVYGIRFFEGTSLEFTPRDVTRGIAALLAYPLNLTESLFFDGFSKRIPALPWITVVGFAGIL